MFELPKLPYEKNALEPFISSETLDYHYGKHHQAYVNNLNTLIAGTDFQNQSLEEIIKTSQWGLFNNAAQVWNHTFYWNSLTPKSTKTPYGKIATLIERDFWDFETFKEQFSKSAATNFASGWTWLVKNKDEKLEIINTDDAQTVVTTEVKPLLVIDVWEHAYYIDVRNARPKYIENFWNLVNWDFANDNLEK